MLLRPNNCTLTVTYITLFLLTAYGKHLRNIQVLLTSNCYYLQVIVCNFKLFQVPKYIANKWEKAPGNIEVGKLKISK
jgi:hypothetical protein